MIGYLSDQRSTERLFEEVAYLAYYFHWPYEQIMGLEHRERQQWVAEVARINRRINEDAGAARGG